MKEWGKPLHHESTGRKGSMEDLARRVYHILSNKGTEDNIICDLWSIKTWTEVTSGDIVQAVRTTAKPIKLW